MKPQRLNIYSDVFDELRDRFEKALLLALRKMQHLKIAQGTVTARVAITLAESADENGENVMMPEFAAQVEINLPMKGKLDVPTKAGLIMVPDPAGEGFIIADSQYSMFDMLEEQNNADD